MKTQGTVNMKHPLIHVQAMRWTYVTHEILIITNSKQTLQTFTLKCELYLTLKKVVSY